MRSRIARVVRRSASPRLLDAAERFVFGSELRRTICSAILKGYFQSERRRHWVWQADGEPHFSKHDALFFDLFLGETDQAVYNLTRAFLVAEVIKDGDVVLDIGCGDGGFTRRFYAPRAAAVDAIDVEASAIATARKRNSHPNIRYVQTNAVTDPFPRAIYDVIVFDGAIGHFSADDAKALLAKVAKALAPKGVFCGSESLGPEGHDHLQFFDSIEDLRNLLKMEFPETAVKQLAYKVGRLARREAYWRCGKSAGQLASLDWNYGQ